MKEFCFKVTKENNGSKIKDFLKEKSVSTEILLKVKIGGIFLNGEVVKNVNNLLKEGDTLIMKMPKDEKNKYITPVVKDLEILYEDEYFIAVNKPKGILTHSLKYNKTLSLEQIIYGYFNNQDFCFRPINRLDKDTSGIIIIAKDTYTASLLGEKLKKGEIIKTYSAVVANQPKSRRFIVEKPILKLPNSVKRFCDEKGKYAKTEFIYVKKVLGDKYLLDAILYTGRTHQIRVHLQSENLSLYGDDLYGSSSSQGYILHAKKIEFLHPFTNKKVIIESPLII